MKRAAAQQELFAQGGLYLGTMRHANGRSYDAYFMPKDEQEGYPDEVQLHLIDPRDERKVSDVGTITRRYHADLCDLVENALRMFHERVAKAMEPAKKAAQ